MALKQDGVHFVLCPKQCDKIEGVVLNRAFIKGFFVLKWVRFQSSTCPPPGGRWQKLTRLGSPWGEERSLERERTSDCDNVDGTTRFVRFCISILSRVFRFIEGKEITTGQDKIEGVICFYCLGKSFRHFAISSFRVLNTRL